MSEFQYIHFVAVDRPLNDKQLAYMERQSTRAEISRWEFTNEYHFGDFHGNAAEMLRRGYDIHFHFADFGIRKLMFRLPELPCDKKTFAAFQLEDWLTWTKDKRGKAGILSIEPESDAGSYDYLDDVHSMLSRISPLREMLLQGDLRPLYLAWLVCCYDDEAMEPPVPAGLGQLDDSLDAMADLFELPRDLIDVAAEQSQPMPSKPDHEALATRWVNGRSKVELKQIVGDLASDDAATVQGDVLREIRQSSPTACLPTTKPSRTLKQLKASEQSLETERLRREAIASDRARRKHLKSIARDPEKTIRRIDKLVDERVTTGYYEIAECLTDLAEALGPTEGPNKARQIAQGLRKRKGRSNALIGVLRDKGWLK